MIQWFKIQFKMSFLFNMVVIYNLLWLSFIVHFNHFSHLFIFYKDITSSFFKKFFLGHKYIS